MKQIKAGETEGEHAFIHTGTTANSINGKTVSKVVSTIVYPIESFGDDQIDVVITLKKGTEAYKVCPGVALERTSNVRRK